MDYRLGLTPTMLRQPSLKGAKATGCLLLLGSALVPISLVLPHPGSVAVLPSALIAGVMALAGALFLRLADRVNLGTVCAALGVIVLVDGLLTYESGVATGQYGSILVWVILIAAYVLPRRAAIAYLAWALATYGLTLALVGQTAGYSEITRWIFAAISMSVVAAFAIWLVAQRSSADARARRFFDLSNDLLCTYSHDGYFLEFNAAWQRILGYSPEEMCSRPAIEFVHPDDRARTVAARKARLRHGTVSDFQARFRTKDGEWRWLRWTSTTSEGEGGLAYARAVDVTDRVVATAERERLLVELSDLAAFDSLTGLLNRRAIEKRLEEEIARAKGDGTSLSLALFDLDSFKEYNDTRGHLAGDAMLCRLAASWLEQVREADVIARWGGEEFMVLLPGCDLERARPIVERLRVATPVGQTCSAGLAAWSPVQSPEDLIREADGALYEAKAAGRDLLALAG
jgi:diguanylate cyclase (GGDEF)-like protein/PAS domain S-box-containing protein